MARRPRQAARLDGLLVVDKPSGPSSAEVVAEVRRTLERGLPAGPDGRRPRVKAGHTGTLDPVATGLLVVCLGEATKLVQFLVGHDKTYRARLQLGAATDTLDRLGTVVARAEPERLFRVDAAAIDAALQAFRGDIVQIPPMYSALKRDGRPLYELAREGLEVERAPRPVSVTRLERLAFDPRAATLELAMDVSSGTYVRTLADDLGRKLGVFAHLVELDRERVGPFGRERAVALDEVGSRWAQGELPLLDWRSALGGFAGLTLDARAAFRVRAGQAVYWGDVAAAGEAPRAGAQLWLAGPDGDLVAMVRAAPADPSQPGRGPRLVIDRVFSGGSQ